MSEHTPIVSDESKRIQRALEHIEQAFERLDRNTTTLDRGDSLDRVVPRADMFGELILLRWILRATSEA
jgi:hypothetical protein